MLPDAGTAAAGASSCSVPPGYCTSTCCAERRSFYSCESMEAS